MVIGKSFQFVVHGEKDRAVCVVNAWIFVTSDLEIRECSSLIKCLIYVNFTLSWLSSTYFKGLLNVVIPQPSYSSILGSNGVTIGCVISGTPSANSVAWTKIQGGQTTNVNIANSNGKYQGGSVNNPSLTILNIAQSDEANYICSATNIAGTSSSQQAYLDVTGSKYFNWNCVI